jgi:hypothetical protein
MDREALLAKAVGEMSEPDDLMARNALLLKEQERSVMRTPLSHRASALRRSHARALTAPLRGRIIAPL